MAGRKLSKTARASLGKKGAEVYHVSTKTGATVVRVMLAGAGSKRLAWMDEDNNIFENNQVTTVQPGEEPPKAKEEKKPEETSTDKEEKKPEETSTDKEEKKPEEAASSS